MADLEAPVLTTHSISPLLNLEFIWLGVMCQVE